jgi:hypothetical protein
MSDNSQTEADEVDALAARLMDLCCGHQAGVAARSLGKVVRWISDCTSADPAEVIGTIVDGARSVTRVTLQ